MFRKLFQISFILLLYSTLTSAQITEEKIDSINSISFDRIVSNLQPSLKIFSENLDNSRKLNYKKGEGISLSKLALVYYLLGQYDKSTEYHIQSFQIFSENNMLSELADAFGEFGYQLKRRDMEKANIYMQKAINLGKGIENQSLLSKLYDNYAVLKEYEEKFDSAMYFSKKALEIKFKLNDSLGIPFSLNKLAGLYAKQGKFKEAFEHLNLSDYFRNKQNYAFGLAENVALRADFFKYRNEIDSALYYYQKTLQLSESLNYNYLISYSLQNISDLYLKKNDYKNAFEYYKRFTTYKDSLDNLEKNSRIAQLEIAYETEQKDKIIAHSNLEIQQRNIWLLLSGIFILIISVFSVILHKYQQQKKERAIKEIEFQNEIKRTQLEKKLLDEKLRISRELHDNIGSQLTFIISSIDNITYQNKMNELSGNLNNIKEFSQAALFDLRNTIWVMKEEKGDFEKLYFKANDFVQRLNNANLGVNISIQFELSEHYSLTSIQMLNLFRIIQEAVQNSVKHASAKNIQIIFKEIDKKPSIIIEDDGKGFDVSNIYEGSGLENMKLRAQNSNSEFLIKSSENGTTIHLSINI